MYVVPFLSFSFLAVPYRCALRAEPSFTSYYTNIVPNRFTRTKSTTEWTYSHPPSPIPTQCLTPARQKVYNYRVKGIYLCTETYIPFKREVYTYCKVRLRGSQRPLGCVAQKSIKTPRHLSMPGQTTLTIMKQWCHQESNRGHKDFQSFALPTELWHPPCFRGKSTCTASVSLETECKGTIFFQTTNTFPFRRSEQIGFSIVLPRGRVPKRALVPARKL